MSSIICGLWSGVWTMAIYDSAKLKAWSWAFYFYYWALGYRFFFPPFPFFTATYHQFLEPETRKWKLYNFILQWIQQSCLAIALLLVLRFELQASSFDSALLLVIVVPSELWSVHCHKSSLVVSGGSVASWDWLATIERWVHSLNDLLINHMNFH